MLILNPLVWLVLSICLGLTASWAKMRYDLNVIVHRNRPLLFRVIENLRYWMPAFAEAHHWPTRKRPQHQGLALARVEYDPFSGQLIELLDVEKSRGRI